MAAMIWSASACFTRGSLAPWPISSGFGMAPAACSGERSLQQLAPRLGARIADPPGQVLEERCPVGRDGRQQRLQVGRADDVDAAAEHLGREGEARQRRVAAVGAAHDGDAVRVGDALLHRPVDGVEQVVVHLAAPFEVAGVDERLAEAGRAAEVDRQHGLAAVRPATGAWDRSRTRRAPRVRRAPAAPSAAAPRDDAARRPAASGRTPARARRARGRPRPRMGASR